MFERAKEIFQTNSNFKCVIILGGTNDLAYKLTGEVIFQNLKAIHQFFLDKGIPTVCVTIPENVFVIISKIENRMLILKNIKIEKIKQMNY
jgi:hypothetical protein